MQRQVADDELVVLNPDPNQGDLRATVAIERVRCASGPFSICSRTDCGIFIYASVKFQNEERLPARKAALLMLAMSARAYLLGSGVMRRYGFTTL